MHPFCENGRLGVKETVVFASYRLMTRLQVTRDVFSSFNYAWILLIFLTIVMIGIALQFNPKNYARSFK